MVDRLHAPPFQHEPCQTISHSLLLNYDQCSHSFTALAANIVGLATVHMTKKTGQRIHIRSFFDKKSQFTTLDVPFPNFLSPVCLSPFFEKAFVASNDCKNTAELESGGIFIDLACPAEPIVWLIP